VNSKDRLKIIQIKHTAIALKNIPRGWRKLEVDETILITDKLWNCMGEKFEPADYGDTVGAVEDKWCVIRKIERSSTPKSPLDKVIKAAIKK